VVLALKPVALSAHINDPLIEGESEELEFLAPRI
jgi:hypothetical protein